MKCEVKDFKMYIEDARRAELYNAKSKGNTAKHYSKWYNIIESNVLQESSTQFNAET